MSKAFLSKRLTFIIVIFSCFLIQCKEVSNDVELTEIAQAVSLSKIIDSLSLSGESLSVFIDKSDRTLTMKHGAKILKSYSVVLGFNPIDDKRIEGDGCTPEGTFSIVDKYPHAKWSKFIWINYPTPNSWNKFNASLANGELPNGATIGGEVGIHGVPKGMDGIISNKTDWTAGCISLSTNDINEIYPFIDKSTAITIQK